MFYATDTDVTKEIIDIAIEEEAFSNEYLYCPECHNIEDDQYGCNYCDGQGGNTKISVFKVLSILYNYKYDPSYESDYSVDNLKDIFDYNGDNFENLVIFYSDYEKLTPLKEDEFDEYISISFSKLFDFLIK